MVAPLDRSARRRNLRARALCAPALRELRYHWGEAFLIGERRGVWFAVRRDTGRTLVADGPGELRALIIVDYIAVPVPRTLTAVRT